MKRVRRSVSSLRQPEPESASSRPWRRRKPHSEFDPAAPIEHFLPEQIEARIQAALHPKK